MYKKNQKIKNLIKPNQFNDNTRSILINAVYFKSQWKNQFDPEKTFKNDFYNNENEKVLIDYMFQSNEFNFAIINELEASALELKYENTSLSFVIVLPNRLNGLSTLEDRLKKFDLSNIDKLFQYDSFDIFIPRFKIEYEIELNKVLKNVGINTIFSKNANLKGLIESNETLTVSNVVQKTFIDINESGAEAAASTYIDFMFRSLSPRFEVNHPFMFYIHEPSTNTILFIGRIEKF